jgi:hypothetical protein
MVSNLKWLALSALQLQFCVIVVVVLVFIFTFNIGPPPIDTEAERARRKWVLRVVRQAVRIGPGTVTVRML